jgi:hypothetical protein
MKIGGVSGNHPRRKWRRDLDVNGRVFRREDGASRPCGEVSRTVHDDASGALARPGHDGLSLAKNGPGSRLRRVRDDV